MALTTIEDCESITLALRLIKHKPRTSIVEVSTGLSKTTIRRLYKSMHHQSPASGQLPHSSLNILSDPHSKLQIMVFFSIYRSMYGETIFHHMYPDQVLNAYDQYLQTTTSSRITPLSLNYCWVFSRELRSEEITIDSCSTPGCPSLFPSQFISLKNSVCPACEIKRSLYCRACGDKLHRRDGCPTCSSIKNNTKNIRKHLPLMSAGH